MKQDIHRWIKTGVATLDPVSTFIEDLEEYVTDTSDPSLLAMTKEQATAILNFLDERRSNDLKNALRERIRICVLQGEYSLQRKRAKRELRDIF